MLIINKQIVKESTKEYLSHTNDARHYNKICYKISQLEDLLNFNKYILLYLNNNQKDYQQ